MITLFEHEVSSETLNSRDLFALERLNRAAGVELLGLVPEHGNLKLKSKEYVGTIRLKHQTVQVLPKMYEEAAGEGKENGRAQQATANLLHLLSWAGQVPIREQDIAPLLKRNLNWFEILTRLFVTHLLEEWQTGAYRTYRTIEDNLPALKGKWRMNEQLHRPERKHLFAVAYDEFTADNPLNRVFRYVVERLRHLANDAENRRRLEVARQWLESVTLLPAISTAECEAIPLTRLNQRYGPLLNLARLFLEARSLQMTAGEQTAFAFVFDMNALYEGFVVSFIRKNRAAVLPETLASCELLPQAQGAARYLARLDGRDAFRLKPDLAFQVQESFPLLLDTKYKRLDGSDLRLGVSQADFYQMYAYARRYDCKNVILLYPKTADMPVDLRARFQLRDTGGEIRVETLDITVDLGSPTGREQLKQQLKAILEN